MQDLPFQAWLAQESTALTAEPTHCDDLLFALLQRHNRAAQRHVSRDKDYPLIAQNTGCDLLGHYRTRPHFSVAKLFFVYGMGGNVVFPWSVGASIVLYAGAPRNGAALLETIERFKPTILYSVPTAYVTKLTLSNMATRMTFLPCVCVSPRVRHCPPPSGRRGRSRRG